MTLEVYLLWDDSNGNRQATIRTFVDWIGGIPRLNEILLFENTKEAYIVAAVRHEFERELISISAEYLPDYFKE